MTGKNIYRQKERVRPPRVQISYDVEVNGAQVQKELPFVVGVLGDLSGQPKNKPGKLKDRKFVEIDRDNFDDVLKTMKPRLAFRVDNKLGDSDSELPVELDFDQLKDFDPEQVVKKIGPLAQLLEIRNRLKDILSRMEGNDRLEEMLDAVYANPEMRDKLKAALDAYNAGGDTAKESSTDTTAETDKE